MKKLILICSLLSMGLSLYLSHRFYSLSTDKATGKSLCHINTYWDCDQTLNSSYSKWAGIPLSNWAFATHFIIALLVFLILIQRVGQNTAKTVAPLSLTLSFFVTLSASASVFMLTVSVFVLKFFCPFCVLLYLLSFIVLFVFYFSPLSSYWKSLFHTKKAFFTKKPTSTWLSFSSVPGCLIHSGLIFISLAFLTHVMFSSLYDISSMKKTVRFNVMDWLSAPEKEPTGQALLSFGPDKKSALLTITEFADFLCVHCRNVYYSLKKGKTSLPSMRVEYFSFPLDQCQRQSLSCWLTRAVYCAKQQQQGWAMHNLIFENQPVFISFRHQKEKAQETLKTLISQSLHLNQRSWQECMTDPSSLKAEQAQIEAGQKWGITGTPALFVNRKKINHIYLTGTLKALYQHLSKTAGNKAPFSKVPL